MFKVNQDYFESRIFSLKCFFSFIFLTFFKLNFAIDKFL
jgi:hypothetical protein